ncbi:hypothetical protein GCM10022393_32000 [Aquimarina addita]|uniref:DUF748 domain-containing protein n=1 Tax=Aquimarina addita TaxID=870485 RepID=A0ABP6URP2_9FLAO
MRNKASKHTNWIKYLILTAVFLLLLFIGAHYVIKKSIHNFISTNLPKNIEIEYDDLDLNLLNTSVSLHQVIIEFSNTISETHTKVSIEEIETSGFSYWDYFINKKLRVSSLFIDTPLIHYSPHLVSKKNPQDSTKSSFTNTIDINNININNGSFTILDNDKNAIHLHLEHFDLTLNNTKINKNTIHNKIPLYFENVSLDAKNLALNTSRFEKMTVRNINLDKKKLKLDSLLLVSKYSKTVLSKKLTTERDHVTLSIPIIQLQNFDIGLLNNHFSISASSGSLLNPSANFYRDKLVQDNENYRPLYSEMLRKLNFNLDIENLNIKNGFVGYQEKIDDAVQPEMITFNQIEGQLNNISNLGKKKTNISLTAKLMNSTPLQLDWEFDVLNKESEFLISGSLHQLNASTLNPFLTSNARAKAKGIVENLYFTISGTNYASRGDIKMKYDDFEFIILHKDRLHINKTLSKIGNLFINDGSKSDADGYRYGTISVERELNKSFFNYLWINLQDGILNTVAGNGKKDKN